jgi:chemotaxis protein CheD
MDEGLPVVYLKAGEMHFTGEPSLVVTVLGSCLSVTMHCGRAGLGAISHGLFPACAAQGACRKNCPEGFRYVECSIRRMLEFFDRAGTRRSEIEVKYFGGADIFSRKIEHAGVVSVGRQNIMAAEAMLNRQGLRVVNRDVGGMRGRKLLFYTHTGEVLLKRLSQADNPDIRW